MNHFSPEITSQIPALLLPWFSKNARSLPWRETSDPYRVWVSEIMLQQTRVAAVIGYYQRFLTALPTITHLAEVSEDALLKLWEGLGYYSRARNLKRAAQIIVADHGGVFPNTYEEMLALPGIGPYTAGAVSSISFSLPHPAIDGNVLRVFARIFAQETPLDKLKKPVHEALLPLYTDKNPGALNQALMELGATVCLPNGMPHCETCPLASFCVAQAQKNPLAYPVRPAKTKRPIEEKTVFILRVGDELAFCKRDSKGLLAGLWALPSVSGILEEEAAIAQVRAWGLNPTQLTKSSHKKHIFTHIEWQMRGFYFHCKEKSAFFTWVSDEKRASDLALPTAFRQFLK